MTTPGLSARPCVTVPAAERVRRSAVPAIALLASCLAQMCLLNLADLPPQIRSLAALDSSFAGWAGAGACLAVVVALTVVVAGPQVRPAGPLAVGTAAAVFGLALGQTVVSATQLALAMLILGVAAGALLGGAVGLTVEPEVRHHGWTAVAWLLPMVGGPLLLDWLALQSPHGGDVVRLSLHPPLWPLAVVSLLLVAWSAATLLMEPVPVPRVSPGADRAWTMLAAVVILPTLAVMLMGFAGDLSVDWLRPLTIAVAGATAVGLGFAGLAMPGAAAQRGFAAAVPVLLLWPALAALLFRVVHQEPTRVPMLVAGAAGVLVGLAWGMVRSFSAVVAGPLLTAVGAAAAWVLLASPPFLPAAVAVLVGGGTAAVSGAVRGALRPELALRLVGSTVVGAVLLGELLGLPLAWALGGAVPVAPEAALAGARVLLGLLAAATLLTAGYTATRRPHSVDPSVVVR